MGVENAIDTHILRPWSIKVIFCVSLNMTTGTKDYVTNCYNGFQEFTGISIPIPLIRTFTIDFKQVYENGYGSWASHRYDFQKDEHVLTVWDRLYEKGKSAEHILFHEMTHIWDTEKHAKNNKEKYLQTMGFTEYHAAQIEMMKVVNCSSISQPRVFSMGEVVSVFPQEIRVIDYVRDAFNSTRSMLAMNSFPQDQKAVIVFFRACL